MGKKEESKELSKKISYIISSLKDIQTFLRTPDNYTVKELNDIKRRIKEMSKMINVIMGEKTLNEWSMNYRYKYIP